MISHVIGTLSDKSVFGLCGPKYNKIYILYILQWTICRKFWGIIVYTLNNFEVFCRKTIVFKINNIICLTNYYLLVIIIIFILLYDQQITITKLNKLFLLNKKIDISEVICSLLTNKENKDENRGIKIFILIFRITLYLKNMVFLLSNIRCLKLMSKTLNFSNKNRYYSFEKDDKLNEWIGGIIDGDGCFLMSKKGYPSIEITMQTRDVNCLYLIQEKYGGSVKIIRNKNYFRYRLHNRQGLLNLIRGINGLIRNPIRLLQLSKVCEKYNVSIIQPKPLNYYNGWLSGFFDTDGSVYLNVLSCQIFVTVAQKNKLLLEPLTDLYGGTIYLSKGKEHFKWILYRKKEVLDILNYFKLYPPKSGKNERIKLISECYELLNKGAHRALEDSILGKKWKEFFKKWENFDVR